MIAAILAAALQGASPATANCDVTFQSRGRTASPPPSSIQIDCPDDVTDAGALQVLANQLAGQVHLRFHDRGGYFLPETVQFERDEVSGWRALPDQILVRKIPSFHPRMMEQGWGFGCVYEGWPDATGRIEDPEVTCFLDGSATRTSMRLAENIVTDAIEESRWLPTAAPYCFDSSLVMNVQDGAASMDPVAPSVSDQIDAARLCEAETEE